MSELSPQGGQNLCHSACNIDPLSQGIGVQNWLLRNFDAAPFATARRLLIVEPWQMQIQRTLPGPENIVAFAADHLPYQFPAVDSLAHDVLDGMPIFERARMAALVSSRRR
jgi:hypothetical protein